MESKVNVKAHLVVIGSGPGGYTAAFRAADLGMDVILIERDSNIGGVCLNRGCVPSKALLHLSNLIDETKESKDSGLIFNKPTINFKKINLWKNTIINSLGSGISLLAKQRKIKIINGTAKFLSADKLYKLK